MAEKKVGALIRQAREDADMTQEKLAAKVRGVSASDIGRLERGEIDLKNEQLKLVAKALNITQSSLLKAPKNLSAKAKKSSADASLKLSAAEKKLVLAYRKASSDDQKRALEALSGKAQSPDLMETLGSLIGSLTGK